MKRAVITGWTGTLFAKMACHTLPLIEEYAERHGAMFGCGNLEGERPPSWNKIILLLKALQQAEEVAWIDCDVVIERGGVSIFDEVSPGAWQALVEHETECGTVPNCGVWVLRQEMVPILQEIWNSGENINHPWWEQASIISRMGYRVVHTNAMLEAPTELHHKTSWLPQEWNHHPSDTRQVKEPYFRHVTMYEDRLESLKIFVEVANKISELDKLEKNAGKVETSVLETSIPEQKTYSPPPLEEKPVTPPLHSIPSNTKKQVSQRSNLKVLFQARSNIFKAKGGDTIAMLRTGEALKSLGVEVVMDPEGRENPKEFDVVHLYNFATPEEIEPRARKAKHLGVPFVVTTLHEDLDNFFNKMRAYGTAFTKHVSGEPPEQTFDSLVSYYQEEIDKNHNTLYRNNLYAAAHAEALLTSGNLESKLLEDKYPVAKRIKAIHFGSEGLPLVGKNIFFRKHRVSDYILCVGRIEWRKNQGMLLKALEDSELPIVLVAGNMTYQPEYQEAVRQFKRKGPVLIVNNLSDEELASAYRGALVHVLPSWYELPGLVSLEAARLGTPVVGTTMGTLSDYMGRDATYCNPESHESIRAAIELAINKPRNEHKLIQRAEQYNWVNTAKKILNTYCQVLDEYTEEDGERKEQEIFKEENPGSIH